MCMRTPHCIFGLTPFYLRTCTSLKPSLMPPTQDAGAPRPIILFSILLAPWHLLYPKENSRAPQEPVLQATGAATWYTLPVNLLVCWTRYRCHQGHGTHLGHAGQACFDSCSSSPQLLQISRQRPTCGFVAASLALSMARQTPPACISGLSVSHVSLSRMYQRS